MHLAKASHPTPSAAQVVRLVLLLALALSATNLVQAQGLGQPVGPITFTPTEIVLPGTPINDLVIDTVEGSAIEPVTFSFNIDGTPSDDGAIRIGPPSSAVLDGWGLEGPTEGILTIDFGQEIIGIQAGIGLRYKANETGVILVTAIDSAGEALQQQAFDTQVASADQSVFAESRILLETPPTTRFVRFQMNSSARRFFFDNLVFVPKPQPLQPPSAALPVAAGRYPQTTILSSGNLAATWLEQGRVRTAVLNPQGEIIHPSRPVSDEAFFETLPTVHALDGGGFAVAWHALLGHGNEEHSSGIYLRIFSNTATASRPPRQLTQTVLSPAVTAINISGSAAVLTVTWTNNRHTETRFVHLDGLAHSPAFDDSGAEESSCGTQSARAEELTLLVWCEAAGVELEPGQDDPTVAIVAQPFFADGRPAGARYSVSARLLGTVDELQATPLPATANAPARVAVAWRQLRQADRPNVFARVLTPTGVSTPILRAQQEAGLTSQPRISVHPSGSFTVTWRQATELLAGVRRHEIYGRAFFRTGVPAASSQPLLTNSAIDVATYSAQWSEDLLQLVWENSATAATLPGIYLSSIPYVPSETQCGPADGHLCLAQERFRVSVQWRDFTDGSGEGTAARLTSDTGYFWFFEQGAADLMVKVLDASSINGKFWVFFGSLTNVEFDLTVEDLLTGQSRSYQNPPLQFASAGDTSAFDANPLPHQDGTEHNATGRYGTVPLASIHPAGFEWDATDPDLEPSTLELPTQTEMPGEECSLIAATIPGAVCLNDRFVVSTQWEDFSGGQGSGIGQALSGDTATYWFFQASNLELMVKILDARGLNDHFWVFYGALTDVAYTVSIIDSATGVTKTYTNPSGNFASVGDLTAFSD